jgi:hypothetical protein
MEPETFRIAVQCLNQLRHRVLPHTYVDTTINCLFQNLFTKLHTTQYVLAILSHPQAEKTIKKKNIHLYT